MGDNSQSGGGILFLRPTVLRILLRDIAQVHTSSQVHPKRSQGKNITGKNAMYGAKTHFFPPLHRYLPEEQRRSLGRHPDLRQAITKHKPNSSEGFTSD